MQFLDQNLVMEGNECCPVFKNKSNPKIKDSLNFSYNFYFR